MARKTSYRPVGTRRLGSSSPLRLETLEDRSVPAAALFSTDFTQAFQASGESAVVGASEDGRYVIIQSRANNFIKDQNDTNFDWDLFWVDRVTGERRLVSAEAGSKGLIAAGVVPSVPGQTANAVISADGLSVAFVSKANANRLVGGPFTIADGGDVSEDVFIWNAELARRQDDPNIGKFASPTALVSRTTVNTTAVGFTSSATNPAISNDGQFVSFVSRLNAATVSNSIISDNGDLTPDVFRVSVNASLFSINVFTPTTITQFPDPLNKNLPSTFGRYTGFVDVDPLGRYMSGDGTGFAIVSSLSPSKLNTSFLPSPGGTIDAYHIQAPSNFIVNPTTVLASSVPGIPGQSVGGQVTTAIIPKNAPNTIVFSAAIPSGQALVPGYLNLNGDRAELYWRQISGINPQPTILVSSAAGLFTTGANKGLDLSIGSFAASGDGNKIFFTTPATNLVTGISDTNLVNDIFVRNISTGITTVISVTSGGLITGNGTSNQPRPTNDGWLVAFESKSTNIVPIIDTNGGTDIFVRDLGSLTTGIASALPDNLFTGNSPSFGPVIGGSKTNAVVLFNSLATNLDPSYTLPGDQQNVYLVRAPLPALDASRIVAVSGGLNGFAGLARFDAKGNLVSGPPIAPFPGFTGEIRVASADVNGDGVPDLIAGAGPNGGPRVRVLNGVNLTTIADIFAFEPSFRGGVSVAGADLNQDGFAEIIIGAGEGGGPRVLIIDGKTQQVTADFFAFESSFRGGVRVAAGDVNGDRIPDLVLAAGEGGGPRIKVITGATLPNQIVLADFFAFEQTLRNGTFVGVGDIDGDRRGDIVAGAGPGGAPRVSVFDANTLLTIPDLDPNDARVINFFAYDSPVPDGVRVTIKSADGDSFGDIVTGPGSGPPQIRVFTTARFEAPRVPQLLSEQFTFNEPIGRLGAYVG